MAGWILGDFLASLFVHRRLREATARTDEASFASVMAAWNGQSFTLWRRLAAIVMVVFLGAYAAAQQKGHAIWICSQLYHRHYSYRRCGIVAHRRQQYFR
jgi:hypothetical protein